MNLTSATRFQPVRISLGNKFELTPPFFLWYLSHPCACSREQPSPISAVPKNSRISLVLGPIETRDSTGKDSAGKDSAGKDSAGKDSAGKDSAGKDSTGKDDSVKDDSVEDDAGNANISSPDSDDVLKNPRKRTISKTALDGVSNDSKTSGNSYHLIIFI